MKKIGILTFHRTNNYGALLQAYALKFSLQNFKTETKIINYLSPKIEKDYKFFSGKKTIKWFIKICIKIFFLPKIIINNNKFNDFRKKYLIDTEQLTPITINRIEKEYDAFITGSDQVFNPRLTGFDKIYFLDFVKDKNKCFSYAASFGLNYENLTDKEKIFIKQNLKNFKCLSLREKQGVDIVSKLSNIKTDVHIDPTLLLDKQDWLKIAKVPKENDFVLVYLMNNNEKIINFTKELSKIKNLKIINISSNFINKTGIKTICVTPEQWINYFINAKYVITNSFHGLAFSVNFNKQFFVDFLPNKFPVNSRLENLLNLTNLKDRLIDNIGTDYDKPINWNSVNKIIEIEREKSINYLKEIVER